MDSNSPGDSRSHRTAEVITGGTAGWKGTRWAHDLQVSTWTYALVSKVAVKEVADHPGQHLAGDQGTP